MKFWKYQGAGNDFIMLDQRGEQKITRQDTELIEKLCDRRFGIGADGLILLQQLEGVDFEMVYFNADGRESTMCGNGGRCIAAFAADLGLVRDSCRFMAIDGLHEARLQPLASTPPDTGAYWVELKMSDVSHVARHDSDYVLNTGSPHFVRFVEDIEAVDVVHTGRHIRHAMPWGTEGINVNFICKNDASGADYAIRTYERGVEDETWACGTGVTAAAIAIFQQEVRHAGPFEVSVQARGGLLQVRFEADGKGAFHHIWLCGPAQHVFTGFI